MAYTPLTPQIGDYAAAVRAAMQHRGLRERDVIEQLSLALPDVETVRGYWWLDGLDVPATQAQHDALKQLIQPQDTAAFDALWNTAVASRPTQMPNVTFQGRLTNQDYAAAAAGNRINLPLGETRRRVRGGPDTMLDEVFDSPRIWHGRGPMIQYNFLSPYALEYISSRTTNMHEFIRVNRLLSGRGGKELSEAMGFNSNVLLAYENRGQHPKHDTLRKLQAQLFNDTPQGLAKRAKLEDLVIRDKVTAGEYRINEATHESYLSYIQHTKDLPRNFWFCTLSAFCFPTEWEALQTKPSWADKLLTPGSQGEFVRAVRLHLNMTQEGLAAAVNRLEPVGLSRITISDIENHHATALNERQYVALLQFFDLQNQAALAANHPAFFNMQIARARFDEWAQRAQAMAREDNVPPDDDDIPYPGEQGAYDLGEAFPRQRPDPVIDAATARRINPSLESYRDSVCVPARHDAFRYHTQNYDNINNDTLRTIANEGRNFHEYVLVSRLLSGRTRVDNLPNQLSSGDLKNMEMQGKFPSYEKLQALSMWLFPDTMPHTPPEEIAAKRTKLEQLYIENKVAIAAGSHASGNNSKIASNLEGLPDAYWDQVFMRLRDPQGWAAQPNPPAWRDAVMEIHTRGDYIRAFRLAHHMKQVPFGIASGAGARLSYIENNTNTFPNDETILNRQIWPYIKRTDEAEHDAGQPQRFIDQVETLPAQSPRAPWPRSAFRLPAGTQDPDLPDH